MKLTRWLLTGAPILALILTMTAGCASTPKPVKCDGRLEPINKPALPANAAPVAKAPPSVASSSQVLVSEGGKGIP
jgi:hypothetical protein